MSLKSKIGNEKIILPGYTRYIGNPYSEDSNSKFWEFTTSAVEYIKEFIKKFPFVVESLEKYKKLYTTSTKHFKVILKNFKFTIKLLH